MEKFNKIMVMRHSYYFGKHHSNWHQYVQLLPYDYNAKIHLLTGKKPFSLVLSHQLPDKAAGSPGSVTLDDVTQPLQSQFYCSLFLQQLDILVKQINSKIGTTQAFS